MAKEPHSKGIASSCSLVRRECELYGILTDARTGTNQRARTKVIFALVVAERRTATISERSSIFVPQRRIFCHKEVDDVTSSFVDCAEGRGQRAARRSDSTEHGLA